MGYTDQIARKEQAKNIAKQQAVQQQINQEQSLAAALGARPPVSSNPELSAGLAALLAPESTRLGRVANPSLEGVMQKAAFEGQLGDTGAPSLDSILQALVGPTTDQYDSQEFVEAQSTF